MKIKRLSKNDCLQRAADDLWTLIVYFDVTRPRYRNAFKSNGKFDPQRVIDTFATIKNLENMKQRRKLSHREMGLLNKASSVVNLTFGIPHKLLNKVLGLYRDEHGKQVRITLDEVLPIVQASHGEITVKNDGHKSKFFTGEDGKITSKKIYSFPKKFLIEKVKWLKMLASDKYETFHDYASGRAEKILRDWEDENKEKYSNKENEADLQEEKKVVEVQQPTPVEGDVDEATMAAIRSMLPEKYRTMTLSEEE